MSCSEGRSLRLALYGVIFLCSFCAEAQEQTQLEPPAHHAVFVFLQRTNRHVKYSKPEVFLAVVNDVFEHLKTKNVSMARDEFGDRRYSEEETSFATVQKIAANSNADSMLYLVVDRPIAKWIRVVAQCCDAKGKLLWSEEAASGGGITGAHGLRVTLDRLHQRLDQHLGQEGLPVIAAERAKDELRP
jgi:hypothetical protein